MLNGELLSELTNERWMCAIYALGARYLGQLSGAAYQNSLITQNNVYAR